MLSCRANKGDISNEQPTNADAWDFVDGDGYADGDGDADNDTDGDADADSDQDADIDGDTDADTDGVTDTDGDPDAAEDSDTVVHADGDSDTASDDTASSDDHSSACLYRCAAHCLSIGGTPTDGTCETEGYKCCRLDIVENTDADTDITGDSDTDADSDTQTGEDGNTNNSIQPFKGVGNSPKSRIERYGVSWCYNWMNSPQKTDCDDPLFVPMIWGGGDVAGEYAKIVNAGYTTVLGFNEPNKSDQANMSVEEAVALWPELTGNPDVRVGSPAVSDDGRWWLEDFMAQAEQRGLRVDFVTVHWYGWNAGSCDTAGGLEGALNWAEKWGRPLWLTEFGCMHESNPDAETVENFFKDALEMFKRHPNLERYAWYPWNTYNHLTDDNGNLTGLGELFSAAPAYR